MNSYEAPPQNQELVDGTISPEDIASLDLDSEVGATAEVANREVTKEQRHLLDAGMESDVQREIGNFEKGLELEEEEDARKRKEVAMKDELAKTTKEMKVAREIADLKANIDRGNLSVPETSSKTDPLAIRGLENVDARTLTIEEMSPKLDSLGRPVPRVSKKEKDSLGREIEDPWNFGR